MGDGFARKKTVKFATNAITISQSAIGLPEMTKDAVMITSNPAIANVWNRKMPAAWSGAKTKIISASTAVSSVSSQSGWRRRNRSLPVGPVIAVLPRATSGDVRPAS